jgi:Cu+-exporting ATPase
MEQAKEKNTKKMMTPIEGMTCAACVNRIEKSLRKMDGVEEVSVNLANEKAMITFNRSETNTKDIVERIEGLGYSVPTAKLDVTIEGMTCAASVNRIEKKVKKMDGVTEASVNLANERATVKYNASIDPVQIIEAIEGLGYNTKKLQETLSKRTWLKKSGETNWCRKKRECLFSPRF